MNIEGLTTFLWNFVAFQRWIGACQALCRFKWPCIEKGGWGVMCDYQFPYRFQWWQPNLSLCVFFQQNMILEFLLCISTFRMPTIPRAQRRHQGDAWDLWHPPWGDSSGSNVWCRTPRIESIREIRSHRVRMVKKKLTTFQFWNAKDYLIWRYEMKVVKWQGLCLGRSPSYEVQNHMRLK